MKKSTLLLLFMLIISLYSRASPLDTTIKGVDIRYRYKPSIFPGSWRISPVNALGKKIIPGEISRTRAVIEKALDKYPEAILRGNLKVVYLLKSMQFFDVGYGGTYSSDAVYLTNDGLTAGYTDNYIEQTFHHEFSSILLRNYDFALDTLAWKNVNVTGFDYNDPESGVGAIRTNQCSQEPDTSLAKNGFLTQYALSSLENDVNTITQHLFSPTVEFWAIAEHYPRIRKKIELLVNFYNKIDPVFTEQYFKKFAIP